MTFDTFGLPSTIAQSLIRLNITTPTPIQSQAIPLILAGQDVMATAQTGTGKTLAYLLPTITKMNDCAYSQALILAPTRELAEQIRNSLVQLLSKKHQADVALLIGGVPIFRQFDMLRKNPRFIIATPGRLIDHLNRGRLKLDQIRYLVLDETDRMLDMGFSDDLKIILKEIPKERQTMMFSATMPTNIIKLSQQYLKNPKTITIGSTNKPAAQIKQEMIKITTGEKFSCLLDQLSNREGSIIIFVKTKIGAAQLADKLKRKDHEVNAIHGDLNQRERDSVIRDFRNNRMRIMVATDVAARGLDIPHVKHVINYDPPQCPEDYIHRIGRTGRAGSDGQALSLILPDEARKWKLIQQFLNPGKPGDKPKTQGAGNKSKSNFDKRRRPMGDKKFVKRKQSDRPHQGRTDR